MLLSEPSRYRLQLYWTCEHLSEEHPLKRTLWDCGTTRWTGQINPMLCSMGVFRAAWLAPHLLGFASKVWNLFSSNISSQCLICCPVNTSVHAGIFQQLHKKIKDRFCWLEVLFMLTSRFRGMIADSVTHTLQKHFCITLLILFHMYPYCYFKTHRIIFLTVPVEQLSTYFMFWSGFIVQSVAKHWKLCYSFGHVQKHPSKSLVWEVGSLKNSLNFLKCGVFHFYDLL